MNINVISPRNQFLWTNFSYVVVLAVIAVNSVSARVQALEPVNLRSVDPFVVLAGSLVSNIPGSAITGDIGLSPASGSNITGFGSLEVTGIVYTVDAGGPAGSIMATTDLTTAKSDLTLAYNDAAGRTPVPTGPFLNPGAGNIGGLTLVPGLYKFTSGLSILGSSLTLQGEADDVWIFQIASDLVVANGIQVILSGGAQAANIFWQVGTSATLGTTSVFKGSILANQSISLNTGASLEGRALASIAAVTLASNVITKPIRKITVDIYNTGKKYGNRNRQVIDLIHFSAPVFAYPNHSNSAIRLVSAKGERRLGY
jgi:Ice-binding-like